MIKVNDFVEFDRTMGDTVIGRGTGKVIEFHPSPDPQKEHEFLVKDTGYFYFISLIKHNVRKLTEEEALLWIMSN